MKKEIPLSKSKFMIASSPVMLITSSWKEEMNIMTGSWGMPLSHNPPFVGIHIGKNHHTYELVKQSGEFIINIPHYGMLKEIIHCGTVSGRHDNKFLQCSLTPEPAVTVRAPSIGECLGYMECSVQDIYGAHDLSLFIGRVQRAVAEEEYFREDHWDLTRIKLVHHLGEQCYEVSGEMIKTGEGSGPEGIFLSPPG